MAEPVRFHRKDGAESVVVAVGGREYERLKADADWESVPLADDTPRLSAFEAGFAAGVASVRAEAVSGDVASDSGSPERAAPPATEAKATTDESAASAADAVKPGPPKANRPGR